MYKPKSTKSNADFIMRTLDVLATSQEALTIQEIQSQDMVLGPLTPQKMSRVLGHLIDMSMAKKAKNRAGRMVYKSTSVMEAQGYEV